MPRAPHLQSYASARAVPLDGDVVRMDLGAHAVEQDPSLAADGDSCRAASEQARGQLLDDRAAELAADRLAAFGDLEGDVEQRLSALTRSSAPRRRSEQRREHRPPGGAFGRLAVHHGTRHDAHRRLRVREQVRGSCDERIGLDAGVDDRSPVASRILEPHGRSPRAMRATWGTVESQSIARCGSLIRPISPIATSIAVVDSAEEAFIPARDADRFEPFSPGLGQVLYVGPLVVDLLAELGQRRVGRERALDDGIDRRFGRIVHERQRTLVEPYGRRRGDASR